MNEKRNDFSEQHFCEATRNAVLVRLGSNVAGGVTLDRFESMVQDAFTCLIDHVGSALGQLAQRSVSQADALRLPSDLTAMTISELLARIDEAIAPFVEPQIKLRVTAADLDGRIREWAAAVRMHVTHEVESLIAAGAEQEAECCGVQVARLALLRFATKIKLGTYALTVSEIQQRAQHEAQTLEAMRVSDFKRFDAACRLAIVSTFDVHEAWRRTPPTREGE